MRRGGFIAKGSVFLRFFICEPYVYHATTPPYRAPLQGRGIGMCGLKAQSRGLIPLLRRGGAKRRGDRQRGLFSGIPALRGYFAGVVLSFLIRISSR